MTVSDLCLVCSRTTCLWALVSGKAYLPRQGASGGPVLSLQLQWNNYEWRAETSSQEYLLYYLFSQSPGSGGENTYKLPALLLSSSLKLLFAAQSRGSRLLALSFILTFMWELSIHWGLKALTWSDLPAVNVLHCLLCVFFFLLKKLELLELYKGLQRRDNCDLQDAFPVFICIFGIHQMFNPCRGLELLSLLLPSGCRLGRHREELFYSGGGCRINVAQTCAWMWRETLFEPDGHEGWHSSSSTHGAQ